jgi:hypothetical protein
MGPSPRPWMACDRAPSPPNLLAPSHIQKACAVCSGVQPDEPTAEVDPAPRPSPKWSGLSWGEVGGTASHHLPRKIPFCLFFPFHPSCKILRECVPALNDYHQSVYCNTAILVVDSTTTLPVHAILSHQVHVMDLATTMTMPDTIEMHPPAKLSGDGASSSHSHKMDRIKSDLEGSAYDGAMVNRLGRPTLLNVNRSAKVLEEGALTVFRGTLALCRSSLCQSHC